MKLLKLLILSLEECNISSETAFDTLRQAQSDKADSICHIEYCHVEFIEALLKY